MVIKKIYPVLCVLIVCALFGFELPQKSTGHYAQWLDKSHVGHKIKISEKGSKDVYWVDYLGDVQSLKKEVFKFVTITYDTGERHGTESKLLAFNAKNELLGGYFIGPANDLPTKVCRNRLVFDYKQSKNACQQITKVDFFKGIPLRLFVACQDKEATIYEFYPDMKAEK